MKKLAFLKLSIPGLQLARYLIKLLSKTKLKCHPLFYIRLTKGEGDPEFYNVSYISDLGLRRSKEPTRFFIENFKVLFQNGFDYSFLSAYDHAIKNYLRELGLNDRLYLEPFNFSIFVKDNIDNPALINQVLMYYADNLGSWEDADQIAIQVMECIDNLPLSEPTASLLTNCGNLFAQRSDLQCRVLYKKALKLWENPYQWFITQFRLAVAEVKRLRDYTKAEATLKETKVAANIFGKKTNNPYNSIFSHGIIANLEALYLLRKGDLLQAGESIKKAWKNVSLVKEHNLDIDNDIANRYRMQIIENMALYYGIIQDWEQSVKIFKEAVEISRAFHHGSLPEALSKYGYALLRLKKFDKAIEVLLEAERLRANSILVDKLREVRKMLAVAYFEMGDFKKSNYWINASRHDLLK